MGKNVLGIDIGNYSLKAAEWKGGSLKDFDSFDMPGNLVRGEEIIAFEALGDFLHDAVRKRFKTHDVALVIPDSQCFIRRLRLPVMTEQQLNVNLPYEFHDIVKGNTDDYIYDYSIIGIVNDDGREMLDMTAACVSREYIDKLKDLFGRKGFKLVKASPRVISTGKLIQVISPFDKDKDFATLDLGYEFTKIDIYKGGVYDLTRTIELGMSHVEAAAGSYLKCDANVARMRMRDNDKGVLDTDQVRGIFDSIAVEVMRAVNYYTFENPENTLDNFYIYGGGARYRQFEDAIKAAVPLNIIKFLGNDHKYNIHDSLNDGLAAVAIGMKLGGKYE